MPYGEIAKQYTREQIAKRKAALKLARDIQKKTDALIKKYLNNPRLKAAGAPISFTTKQAVEFAKCADDPLYFIERYVKIVNLDEGLIPIKLYPKQREMIELVHAHQKSIIKAARQVGKTTTLGVGYILWYILFNSDKKVGILANKEDTAQEILNRIRIAYCHLPLWIQQGVIDGGWNKTSIELENGSGVLAASTSSSAIRGWSINFLYLDEFAHVPPNVANEFFASVFPTISSGRTTKMVITSTPKGLNQFYALYRGSELKPGEKGFNGFASASYDWTMVPWRDQKWADEQLATFGEELFEQEYLCEFHGSSGTLISGKFLRNMAWITPLEKKMSSKPGIEDHKLFIYTKPVPGHVYLVSVDTSHGKELDDSAFVVIDITEAPYRIVARFADNSISPYLYPQVVVQIAKHYNSAWILAENNDVGDKVIHIITQDLEYENVIYTTDYRGGKLVGDIGGKTAGVRTTPKVKRQGCMILKTLIESTQLIVEDYSIIEQFGTFIMRPNRTYAADEGKRDDLVMTLVIFAWLTSQDYFKSLADIDFRKRIFEEKNQAIEQDLPPAPVLPKAMQAKIPGLPQNFYKDQGVIWEIVGNPDDDGAIGPEDLYEGPHPNEMWDNIPDVINTNDKRILPKEEDSD